MSERNVMQKAEEFLRCHRSGDPRCEEVIKKLRQMFPTMTVEEIMARITLLSMGIS